MLIEIKIELSIILYSISGKQWENTLLLKTS